MAFIPVPNTIQLELVYAWDNQVAQTVLHYTKASPWTPSTMTEACVSMIAEWNTGMKPLMPLTLSLIQIRATDLSSATGTVINYATGLPIAGTNSAPSLPNSVAMVVTKRTLLRGRSYRGRIYHPGLNESAVLANQVLATTAAQIVAVYTAMMSLTLTADEATMTVVSRFNNNAPRATGVATLVNNMTTDGVVDSQRRRLPGRGR